MLCALAALLWALPTAGLERPPWASGRWPYRKLLLVRGAEGPEPAARAWVHLRPEADYGEGALRMSDPQGRSVRFGVVRSTPEGRYLVAFDASAGDGLYALYYGNAAAGPLEGRLPRRGLVLETRSLPEGAGAGDWESARRALRDAPVQGADFWPRVFDAHNPFGPQSDYIAVYRGHIRCPKSGVYRFATVSGHSSFLLVDGRLVVAWPGAHDAREGRRGEHSGSVRLSRGTHSFRYVHFAFGGRQRRLAAWAPPGRERFRVIPPEAFLPPAEAEVYETERADGPICADFTFSADAYLEAGAARTTAVRFTPTATAAGGPITGYRWRFGDGQRSAEPWPRHVFLAPGTYEVTLIVTSHSGRGAACTKKLKVGPLWNDLDFRRPKKRRFADLVAAYDLERLPTDCLLGAWEVLRSAERSEPASAAARRLWNQRSEELAALRRHAVGMFLADHYQRREPNPDEAERYLRKALEALPEEDRALRMETRYELAEHYLLRRDRPERARKGYAGVRADFPHGDPELRRRALIRIGDTHRRQGDAEAARDAYRRAGQAPTGPGADPSTQREAALQQAEAHLREGRAADALERLEELLWRHPLLRLEGRPTRLRAHAERMQGRFRRALRRAETYLGFAEDPNYLPAMHLEAAEACLGLGRMQAARQHYRAVLEEFPESPRVPAAQDGLDHLSF